MKSLNNKRQVIETALITAHLLELEKLAYKKELISYLCAIYIHVLYTAKKQKI